MDANKHEYGGLRILLGDALENLRELPDESVHCCVTSPPYWGLRDYGTATWKGGDDGCDHVERTGRNDVTPEALARRAEQYETGQQNGSKVNPIQFTKSCGKCGAKRIDAQIGLEKTPEKYVAKMVEVFREVRRVLRKDGTLWLNLGDSYAGAGSALSAQDPQSPSYPSPASIDNNAPHFTQDSASSSSCFVPGSTGPLLTFKQGARNGNRRSRPRPCLGLKPKDLCGIPWRVAFALQADGWYLRQDIIWAKPNPMPESVTDRCTKAHEYLFLLTKSARYFYDAVAIKERAGDWHESIPGREDGPGQDRRQVKSPAGWKTGKGSHGTIHENGREPVVSYGEIGSNRNKRSVWTVATAPYPEAHFATYPPDLIKPCILAGTSAKGCCAKCGAPWERIVEVTDSPTRSVKTNGPVGDHGFLGENRRDIPKQTETLGWQPTCVCHLEYSSHPTIPGTVLDPFAGSGTTGQVALELGRMAILIELNPKYAQLIRDRCNVTPGFALAV